MVYAVLLVICNILINVIYSDFLKIGGRNSTLSMNTIDITSKKFGFYNITVAAYDLFNGYKYLDSVEVPLFVKVIYIDIRWKKVTNYISLAISTLSYNFIFTFLCMYSEPYKQNDRFTGIVVFFRFQNWFYITKNIYVHSFQPIWQQ